ncbi:RidA family protein [uncultured Oceanisphaera sp.]|uniref:RidA family protein n=1 Tax=uncultured Oceanisphaera sp. TaxID=353858 RepID=UPI00263171F2|nr:RidA family protein [uncultured Oceanisphaera sp.]
MTTILRKESSPRMSQTVAVNNFVFLSGQVADNLQGDIRQQTTEVLAKIERLLSVSLSDKSRLISVNIWLSDMSHFDEMNEVYEAWLDNSHQPTRACVQSALADPGYLIEAQAVALATPQA